MMTKMMKKINESQSALGNDFSYNMHCRLDERLDTNLINLLKALKEPGFLPSKNALNLGSKLLERLFSWDLPSNDNNIENRENEKDGQEPLCMANELSMNLLFAPKTGQRTENLDLLCDALCSIKPTSTDNERTFSVASNFCTKIKSRMSDKSLNSLNTII
jgi:hypothetical protein